MTPITFGFFLICYSLYLSSLSFLFYNLVSFISFSILILIKKFDQLTKIRMQECSTLSVRHFCINCPCFDSFIPFFINFYPFSPKLHPCFLFFHYLLWFFGSNLPMYHVLRIKGYSRFNLNNIIVTKLFFIRATET